MTKLLVVVAVASLCCLVHADEIEDCDNERNKDDFKVELQDGTAKSDDEEFTFEATEPNDEGNADRVKVEFHLENLEEFYVKKLKVEVVGATEVTAVYQLDDDTDDAEKQVKQIEQNNDEDEDEIEIEFNQATQEANRIIVQAKCAVDTTCSFQVEDMGVCLV